MYIFRRFSLSEMSGKAWVPTVTPGSDTMGSSIKPGSEERGCPLSHHVDVLDSFEIQVKNGSSSEIPCYVTNGSDLAAPEPD